ncbi:hypothetical protein FTX61_07990 [Nitriliruptoraceae bacterium ZYF776]|nr:hypothetical protein [Profundirhabdus halotolerans]
MSERWKVVRDWTSGGEQRWFVRDATDHDREVARFATRDEAQAHVDRLREGPFDWDEQEAWQDDEDEDDRDTGP